MPRDAVLLLAEAEIGDREHLADRFLYWRRFAAELCRLSTRRRQFCDGIRGITRERQLVAEGDLQLESFHPRVGRRELLSYLPGPLSVQDRIALRLERVGE